jgi:3-hydroxyacyl-CoA dehydrogenase
LVATVVGAGTMGAQVAAHLANAGIRTYLLDIVPRDVPAEAPSATRSALARGALKQMAKGKPPPFMQADVGERIQPGNLDDDLEDAVSRSDLVVEAVVERLDIKQKLFSRLAAAAPEHAILATNTSGISIAAIADGLPEEARSRVVGMHFFNPPRYMHLLEVVPSRYTAPSVVEEVSTFSDRVLGKGIVLCRDTPNFIGNRVGTADLLLTFAAAFDGGYTVEEVDQLNGPLTGRPRTGSFRLSDLIGIDIAGHIVDNLRAAFSGDPKDESYDELYDMMVVHPKIAKMIEAGLLGDKTGKGFYRKTRDERGKRKIESLDLESLEYRDRTEPAFAELADIAKIPKLEERVAAALRAEGRAGEFLRKVQLPLLNYAANRVGAICDTPKQIDDAMCWGYGWKLGPFALWDAAGVAWSVEQLESMGIEPAGTARALLEKHGKDATFYTGSAANPKVFVPVTKNDYEPLETPEGVIRLDARRADGKVIHENPTASLVDLGDGIACLEFRSKANIIDDGVLAMLQEAVPTLEKKGGFRGLVIGNQGEHFGAGADLRELGGLSEKGDWAAIEKLVARFQNILMDLRHGSMPVVAAPHGMALGGAAETVLAAAAVQAGAELYMGFVEAGVGLLPAGGGLKEMCRRASAWAAQAPKQDPQPWIQRAFENAATARVSGSAANAREIGLLAPSDRITFHRTRVVADAKRRAVALAEAGWMPPDRDEPIRVVGAPGGATFMLGAKLFEWGGYASEHDRLIGEKIAHVLSGGMAPSPTTLTAAQLLDLEREAFVNLCGEEKTRARMEHMLKTGKPLRN